MHAVIYCDGGYKPSVHLGGIGVHGYFYDPNKEKPKGIGNNKVFATDKGYVRDKTNCKLVEVTHYLDIHAPIYNAFSNNLSELQALYISLVNSNSIDGVTEITIISDSKYALDGLVSAHTKWKHNGWYTVNGDKCKNIEIWKEIEPLYEKLLVNAKINLVHVHGHNGDYGNSIVDQYATKAMFMANSNYQYNPNEQWYLGELNYKLTDAKGYWKKPERTNFTNSTAWYVDITEPRINIYGYHGYMLADIPTSVEDGRASPLVVTKLICSKEPIELFENVIDILLDNEAHSKVGVVKVVLDDIYDRTVYNDIHEHGSNMVRSKTRKFNLMTGNDQPFAHEPSPSGLIYVSIQNYKLMEMVLGWYLNNDPNIVLTSFKDTLFETIGDKLSLRKEFTVSTKYLETKVNVNTGEYIGGLKYRFLFGYDIPKRNHLARMADSLLNIYVMTWGQSANAVSFVTIVELEEGIMVMNNIETNTLFVPTDTR